MKPIFQNIRKLPILFHGNYQGTSSNETVVILKFNLFIKMPFKEWIFFGHRRSDLWAMELGICYSNVCEMISAAPLIILSSIYTEVGNIQSEIHSVHQTNEHYQTQQKASNVADVIKSK